MRHQYKGSKLGRTTSHRKATLRSLSIALIKNERIVTTTVKAKELRRTIEPLITRAKEDTTHNRREVFAFLHDNESTSKLFNEIGPKCVSRPGGYTRVVKIGTRKGDGSEVSVIELVDYNDVKPEGGTTKKKRTRRGGGKKEATTTPASKPAKASKEEAKPAEVAAAAEEAPDEVVAEAPATEAPVAENEEKKDAE